jgi:hypothetical protein
VQYSKKDLYEVFTHLLWLVFKDRVVYMFFASRSVLVFLLACSLSHGVEGHSVDFLKKDKEIIDLNIEPYLLPRNHPLNEYLKLLFIHPKIFKSSEYFKKAGFKVIRGHKKLMVGAHPFLPGYLFKKFPEGLSQKVQLENFIKRINGAKLIQKYITEHKFTHLVVPQKWIYQLPTFFSKKSEAPSYLLVVEDMNIYGDFDDSHGVEKELYYNMNLTMLTEFCILSHAIGGCDDYPRNQPFTHSGKIAFVDTEHVGAKKDHFIRHIVPALNPEKQAYALDLWKRLEEQSEID